MKTNEPGQPAGVSGSLSPVLSHDSVFLLRGHIHGPLVPLKTQCKFCVELEGMAVHMSHLSFGREAEEQKKKLFLAPATVEGKTRENVSHTDS